jgi:hypothetical protein
MEAGPRLISRGYFKPNTEKPFYNPFFWATCKTSEIHPIQTSRLKGAKTMKTNISAPANPFVVLWFLVEEKS